jgi:chromosome partitioning protein
MARKIAVTLRKGGSGKTTTAVNLAAALNSKNRKVLLVDLDPQANATISVGVDPLAQEKHINKLFTDINIEPSQAIVKTSFGLFLLPSHPDLADTEAGMNAAQVGILRSVLEELEEKYDFIIVDTPPSESYLTVNALAYVDEVIITLQAHYLAMRGLEDILGEIVKVKQGLNPSLSIAGILPTMVNQRTNIAQSVLETVKEAYGEFLYPFQVNFSIRHPEASLAGLPIILYAPDHQGSEAYMRLAEEIIRS